MAEHGVDELFALPLEEFTAARNRLAKSLGREEGEEVRALAKPSVPAWTVNQLVRRRPDALRGLLAHGEALQRSQQRALRERGRAKDIREAQERVREAIGELIRHARSVLEEAGRPATRPMLDRVAATLEAGAQTKAGRAALRSGRLSEELEPAGFAALAGIAPAERGGSVHDELAARRKAREEHERRRRELREEARELESRARAAEREAARAEAAVEKARAAAAKARQRADEAAAALAKPD